MLISKSRSMISHPKQVDSNIEQYLVGLTGNICSGKTKVSEYFHELGACVIDLDKVVHDLYRYDFSLKYSLYKEFGLKIFNFKLEIDRKKLGKIVFSDKEKMKQLESIVWPYVAEKAKKDIKDKKDIIIFEGAMIYEAGLDKSFDRNVFVFADENKRLKRLVDRNNVPKEEALNLIKSQAYGVDKKAKADYVVKNNSSFDVLKKNVGVVWKALNKDFLGKKNLSTGG